MEHLKERAVRGGFAKLVSHGVNFVLRLGSLIVLVRLLDPADFGLVAMVTAITGIYSMFITAGLSSATVQREVVNEAQISNLFWVNVLIGAVLGLTSLAAAPALVAFYNEPRLWWMTIAISAGFLVNAAGVQHSALLQRQLRYVAIAVIDTTSLLAGVAISIGMAMAGYGYWSLVAMTTIPPAVNTAGVWIATCWVPQWPSREAGTGEMLRFGGTLTLNGFVVYVAYNLEKVLLGRFWGAEALGIYGRAYQLVNIPSENLIGALGTVVFSALSRLQSDAVRFRSYFLKCYFLVNSVTIPITLFCGLQADDIVMVVLGPKWMEAALIFRLLTPTVLIFGIINPLAWLLFSSGLQNRSLAVACVIAPLVIAAYVIGLPYGPPGVALAYSTVMALWLVPHVIWCLHGTVLKPWDLMVTISRPLISGVVAAAFAFAVLALADGVQSPLLRIFLGGGSMAIAYAVMLLVVMGQKDIYLDILQGLTGRKGTLHPAE